MAVAARRFSLTLALGNLLGLSGRSFTVLLGRRLGTRVATQAASRLMPVVSVRTKKGLLKFWCVSPVSAKRALGFLRQEPETRAWIDRYVREGDHMWDVGANVGAYSLCACLTAGVTVTAFEPMAATFAILARNVQINGLGGRVTALCMALSDASGLVPIHLASLEPGSAMHAIGIPENVRGPFASAGTANVMAVTGADLLAHFGVAPPDHVKIDVDGHEMQVLTGLAPLLPRVKSICMEVIESESSSGERERLHHLLARHGFAEREIAAGKPQRNRVFVNVSAADSDP